MARLGFFIFLFLISTHTAYSQNDKKVAPPVKKKVPNTFYEMSNDQCWSIMKANYTCLKGLLQARKKVETGKAYLKDEFGNVRAILSDDVPLLKERFGGGKIVFINAAPKKGGKSYRPKIEDLNTPIKVKSYEYTSFDSGGSYKSAGFVGNDPATNSNSTSDLYETLRDYVGYVSDKTIGPLTGKHYDVIYALLQSNAVFKESQLSPTYMESFKNSEVEKSCKELKTLLDTLKNKSKHVDSSRLNELDLFLSSDILLNPAFDGFMKSLASEETTNEKATHIEAPGSTPASLPEAQ